MTNLQQEIKALKTIINDLSVKYQIAEKNGYKVTDTILDHLLEAKQILNKLQDEAKSDN